MSSKYENGAKIMDNGLVIEPEFVDMHEELSKEVGKLKRNVEELGKKELPDSDNIEDIRSKGEEVLKEKYSAAYKKLIHQINNLANENIKTSYTRCLFFKDAAETLEVDPTKLIAEYIREDAPKYKKALLKDFSMEDFDNLIQKMMDKVMVLVIDNWNCHRQLEAKK